MIRKGPDGEWLLPEQCTYCGCRMTYYPVRVKISHGTREQKRAIAAEVRATLDVGRYREQMAALGYDEGWTIGYRCPGCGACGSRHRLEYTEAEAIAIAAERSRPAETDEARVQAANWKGEVRRRAEQDARVFAELLLARFPHWEPHVRFISPEETSEEPGEPPWDAAWEARIPSENPAIEQPLRVWVLGSQILPMWWGGWHEHVERGDAEPGDPTPLREALEIVEALVTEKILICAGFRGDQLRYSSHYDAATYAPPPRLAGRLGRDIDREEERSWRGTYDRITRLALAE